MSQKKKAPKAEEDELTQKMPAAYRRKCDANGIQASKMIRQRLDNAIENGKLEQMNLWEELGPIHTRTLMEALTEVNYIHLRKIRFWKVDVQDEGLRGICNFIDKVAGIEYLDLMDNKITQLGCEFLGKTLRGERCRINKLKLDNNPIGNEGLRNLTVGLRENSVIQKLSFNFCNIDGNGVKYIQEILANIDCKLRTLKLMGNPLENNGVYEVLRAVRTCGQHLEKLNLADTRINILNWREDLGETIEEKIERELTEILRENRSIAKYNFRNNWISEDVARRMLNQVKDNKVIFIIELPDCLPHRLKQVHAQIMKKRKPKKKAKGKGKGKAKKVAKK